MVTMIMLMVITLIVLGFAQIARREQRQSLDRDLSTSAFYAAESGVNDAVQIIRTLPNGSKVDANLCPVKDAAGNPKQYPGTSLALKPDIDTANGVSYTCLIVNSGALQELHEQVFPNGTSKVLALHPDQTADTFHLTWKADTPTPLTPADVSSKCSGNVPPAGSFPKSTAWTCPYGVLRIDLVPTDGFNRQNLDQQQRTIFFYPTAGGAGSVDFTQAGLNGSVQPMNCDQNSCRVDITGVGGHTNYSMRAMTVYQSGTVYVTASDASGTRYLKDAQAEIDVTGKAQDVLRRVQVRVNLDAQGKPSNYAVESGASICKRFTFTDKTFNIPDNALKNDTANPYCVPFTPPCLNTIKDIALVLDDSLTMKLIWNDPLTGKNVSRLTKLKEVAGEFISQALSANPKNRVAVLPFNSDSTQGSQDPNPTPPLKTPLTNDATILNNAVNILQDSTTHCCTEYKIALGNAQKAFSNSPNPDPTATKVVVFISDGEPTDGSSAAIRKTIVDMATQAVKDQGAIVYTIGITNDAVKAARYMMDMATQPNSPYYTSALNPQDLNDAVAAITSSLVCTP